MEPVFRKYLITGAGRGIGRGLARNLLAEGHHVFLLDSNKAELDNTLKLCSTWSHLSPFKGSVVDLSDRLAVKKAVQEAGQWFGGSLDVLVNNAFATPHTWADGKGMEDDPDSDDILDQWDLKIAVGLTAPFLLSRLCVPLLKKGQTGTRDDPGPGCIINIASTRAYMAEDNHEAYSAAKGGILGLTQSSSISLGHRHGIRVNAILPGWISIDNENAEADKRGTNWTEGMSESDHKWHPAGRVGRVEDVTKTVNHLAASTFMTGAEITLDGGVTRKMVYPE